MPRILMTGAAGGIGTNLRKLLPPIYPDLLLSDLNTPAGLGKDEKFKAADLADVTGKRCTFAFFPWNWDRGDGCIIRLVAIVDPKGSTIATFPGLTRDSAEWRAFLQSGTAEAIPAASVTSGAVVAN